MVTGPGIGVSYPASGGGKSKYNWHTVVDGLSEWNKSSFLEYYFAKFYGT